MGLPLHVGAGLLNLVAKSAGKVIFIKEPSGAELGSENSNSYNPPA